MGTRYEQLDLDDRIEISRHRENGLSFQEIGRLMGRPASTISREVGRNALPKSGYKPASADRMALSRRRRLSRIECLNPLRDYVCDHLAMGWSPEQIAGRLRREGSEHTVGTETIYRFIYRPPILKEKLYRFLPRAKACRGRRYFKSRREPLSGRRSIHERPPNVALRDEFGHWEGDLMQFRTQRGNLLTLCERRTRFVMAAPLKSKTAAETAKAIIGALERLPEGAYKTITFDNGSEFTQHADMEDSLKIAAYFCDPHSPWQRGSIENTNGVLRRDLPRKSDITDYSRQDIREITWAVNTTPRKCLGFLSPAEAFLQNIRCCT